MSERRPTARLEPASHLLRLRVQGFEIAIALLVLIQGLVSILGGPHNPVEDLLPEWQVTCVQLGFVLSGLLILSGLLLHRGDVEGAGLVVLAPLLMARAVLYGYALGWGVEGFTTLAFSFFVAFACVGRLTILMAYSRRAR